MRLNRFAKFSWGLLGYNLLVILWGAYVRASGSGAGCGAHWPLCNGVIIPQNGQIATMIEFTHRIMSGATVIFSVGLAVWAWRAFGPKDLVRLGATLVLIFTFTEALVGAGLVLLELVASDASVTRAVSVAVHLVNTLLLLASVTLTAWWASGGKPFRYQNQQGLGILLIAALLGVMFLSASGAINALGDTLFPTGSLTEGLKQDALPTANFLIRLRIYHPIIAVAVGLYGAIVAVWTSSRKPNPLVRRLAYTLVGFFVLQLTLGALNVVLLAPVWMQMIHLLVADLVWICLVLLTSAALSSQASPEAVFDHKIAASRVTRY